MAVRSGVASGAASRAVAGCGVGTGVGAGAPVRPGPGLLGERRRRARPDRHGGRGGRRGCGRSGRGSGRGTPGSGRTVRGTAPGLEFPPAAPVGHEGEQQGRADDGKGPAARMDRHAFPGLHWVAPNCGRLTGRLALGVDRQPSPRSGNSSAPCKATSLDHPRARARPGRQPLRGQAEPATHPGANPRPPAGLRRAQHQATGGPERAATLRQTHKIPHDARLSAPVVRATHRTDSSRAPRRRRRAWSRMVLRRAHGAFWPKARHSAALEAAASATGGRARPAASATVGATPLPEAGVRPGDPPRLSPLTRDGRGGALPPLPRARRGQRRAPAARRR